MRLDLSKKKKIQSKQMPHSEAGGTRKIAQPFHFFYSSVHHLPSSAESILKSHDLRTCTCRWILYKFE